MSDDPRLVNPTTETVTADFQPQPTSPAVGMAAAVEPSLTLDMVGRPRGGRPADRGCLRGRLSLQ
jgi:hypothetical protein